MSEMRLAEDSRKLAALLSSSEFHEFLVHGLGVGRYQVLAPAQERSGLVLVKAFPENPSLEQTSVLPDSPLLEFFASGKDDHLAAVDAAAPTAGLAREAEARRQLKSQGWEHAFALRPDHQMLGLLLAGAAANRPRLSPEEVNRLRLFVRFMSAAAGLLLAAESQELLGGLSPGLAHDLKGWLTPIATSLQLWSGDRRDQSKAEALRPAALRSLEAIQACLAQARYLSQHRRPRFQKRNLARILRQAVALADTSLAPKHLTASIQVAADLEAEVDEVLMLRLLSNLLMNAIRASPPGKEVRLEWTRAEAAQGQPEAVRLRVINQGPAAEAGADPCAEGFLDGPEFAPKEEANREPDRAKTAFEAPAFVPEEGRGWGLGLQICREIARLHGGCLALSTGEAPPSITVQVDLPRFHPPPAPGPR